MTTAPMPADQSSPEHLIRSAPNDVRAIQAVQQRLAQQGTTPETMRLLFEFYLAPGLQPVNKSLVTSLILNAVQGDIAQFQPASVGLNTESPAFKMIYKGFAHNLDKAFAEIDLLRKLQRDDPDESLWPRFIIAIPKSGSSLLGICIGNMIKLSRGGQLDNNPFMFRGYPSWWQVGETHDWDLRPEVGADMLFRQFPGGIYKGHINPIPKNFAVLDLYKHSKYQIIIRDPRDQIVADYCQHLRFGGSAKWPGETTPDKAEVQRDLVEFMRGGQLIDNLSFVGKWLTNRHADRSMVVTYEDLMQEPIEVLDRSASHFGLPLGRDVLEKVYTYAEGITNRTSGADTSGHDTSIYPLGWTGEVGIWETYFSDEASDLFDQTMLCLENTTPWARAIRGHYPALSPVIPSA